MFSEHVDIAEKIRQVFIERIDDERKICSLEVNVLDLKTFEILLMDRQAIIGVDEAERIADGDEDVVGDLLVDLCRTVHTPLYDRRRVLIRTRQHLYAILEEARLLAEFRREFLQVYEESFQEEERSDDRSRMLEVSLEVDWLKSRIAAELARGRTEEDEVEEDPESLVTVEIAGEQITIDIPETQDVRPDEVVDEETRDERDESADESDDADKVVEAAKAADAGNAKEAKAATRKGK